MIEIRQVTKNYYNYGVYKDGVHVDAIVTFRSNPKKWVLWGGYDEFSSADLVSINQKLQDLNS